MSDVTFYVHIKEHRLILLIKTNNNTIYMYVTFLLWRSYWR